MRNFKLRWGSIARAMLFSAAAFLVCGTALAQVNGFVVINPISVCSGGLCAPFGMSCTSATGSQVCTQFSNPSAATVNTPIGFVDADKNVNLTRAFWAQAGIDVVFFPVQSYNSPTNAIPSSWNNIKDPTPTIPSISTFTYTPTTYQTLHLVNVPCADGFIALTSPDFEALTQHPVCTEHGGLGPSFSKLVNPPPAPSPAPPLAISGCSQALPCSTNSNAIDMFFVNNYSGTAVTIPAQYGFSWINGDGVSIGSKLTLSNVTTPRFDTVAHEIGHALALDHMSFGASSDTTNIIGTTPVGNLMLLGATRATSSKSGCQTTTNPLTTTIPPVYTGGALFDLDYNTSSFIPCGIGTNGNPNGSLLADHLTTGPACTDPTNLATCTDQAAAAAISPFINKTAPNTANAGGGSGFAASLATQSTPNSSGSGTPTPLPIKITASGDPNDPEVPDLASNIIGLQASGPLSFSGNHPVTQIGGTSKNGLTCDANNLNNCAVILTSVVKLGNNSGTGNPNCDKTLIQPTPSAQCVELTYSGFRPGFFIEVAVDFNKDSGTIISQNLLTGAQYTSIDAAGFATSTLFGPVPAGATPPNVTGFTADSQNPDLTTANVLLNANTFQNASAVKFSSPPFNNRKLAQCTPPYTTVFVKIKGQLVPETVCPDGNLPAGD